MANRGSSPLTAAQHYAPPRAVPDAPVLVVLSGGQDSTTCLYWAKHVLQVPVHAITFDYGQRHRRELDCALQIGGGAGVLSHKLVKLGDVLEGTSPLVSANALEQYADAQSLPGGIEKTFVPMRNMLFLTIAANRAAAIGAGAIVTGVSQEDYGGYPDCRETFIHQVALAIKESLGESVRFAPRVYAPLMHRSKADTVRLAVTLPGCMEALAYSHTAYDGAYPPTGKDHATLLRAKGFEEAGWPDPLVVRAFREDMMPLPSTPNYTDVKLQLLDTLMEEQRSKINNNAADPHEPTDIVTG